MPKTKLITVIIDEDIHDKLQYIRKTKGVTIQFSINSILKEALTGKKA
jgi:hypothetical protein